MTRKKIILGVLILALCAVVVRPQGANLVRIAFKTLIGPQMTAPSAPPTGYHEIFFDEGNSNHTTRKAPDGSLHDLEETVPGGAEPFKGTFTDHGGFIGNRFNSAGASTQAPFNGNGNFRTVNQYWLSPIMLCTKDANVAGHYKLATMRNKNLAGTTSSTPLPTEQGTPVLPSAAAGCYRGFGNLVGAPEAYAPVLDIQTTGPTGATVEGWVLAIYGSRDTPFSAGINGTVALSSTNYTQHGATTNATEANMALPLPVASTLVRLCVSTNSTQSSTGSLVFNARKNGDAHVTMLTVVANAAAGRYCSTSGTTAGYAAGDWYALQIVNNATATSATILTVDWAFQPASETYSALIPFGNGAGATWNTGFNPNYWHAIVGAQTLDGTESNHRFAIPRNGTMGWVACKAEAALSNSAAVVIQKNGVDSTAALTYTSGSTAVQTSSTTDTFNDLDSYSMEVTHGAGSTPTWFACMAAFRDL